MNSFSFSQVNTKDSHFIFNQQSTPSASPLRTSEEKRRLGEGAKAYRMRFGQTNETDRPAASTSSFGQLDDDCCFDLDELEGFLSQDE